MPITVNIKPNQTFHIHGKGLYRFVEEDSHNVLVFHRSGTNHELRMPEHEFVARHGKRELTKISIGADGQIVKFNEFGPGEAWTDTEDPEKAKLTPEGKRALALQFYTVKWDKEDEGPLGNTGLQKLIVRYRPTAIAMGFESADGTPGYRVQVATLRRCIHTCGSPGERPLAAFRSARGKGQRKRYHNLVEKTLSDTVTFYYEERSRDFNDAYGFFRAEMKRINQERRRRNDPPIAKIPLKPEIIRRRIRQARCYATWATKYGPKAAYKKYRGQKDHISAQWPLELAVMDSTTFDDWTVLDTETYLPLGRPTLSVCLDVATRMPLGYLLTFEPPSLYSALLTLKRVNKNKNYMTALYPHITRKWDGWGLLSELLLDQDWANKAPSLQHSMGNIGTDIHWAPADTPEYKSIGERFFRTINTRMAHKLAGGVPYNVYIMRQVGLDPKKDAVITLADLDALIHEFIVDYIHDKHTGLGAVPARVWRDKLMINRRRWISDVAALDHILGRVDTATLTNSGIRFKNMDFHDEVLTGHLLEDLAKDAAQRSQSPLPYTPSRVRVVIKYNPADAGSIVVWNRATKEYVKLPNRDPRFFEGISFWHVAKILEHTNKLDLDFSSEADRWESRDNLRKSWEKLAGKLPMRDSRNSRRGLAFSLGQFDDTTVNEMPDITLDQIFDVEAEPSTAGLNAPENVPDELAVLLLDDENKPVKGKSPSKKTVAKIARTKAANQQEKAEAEHAAYVKQNRGDPTGEPDTRSTPPVDVEDDFEEGWGDAPDVPADAATTAPGDDDDDNEEGWD